MSVKKKPRLVPGGIWGEFSKGNEFSVSVNFGLSGGPMCDTDCQFNPNNPDPEAPQNCYAVRTENRPDRQALKAKLKRHEEMGPALVAGRAIVEFQAMMAKGYTIEWCRVTTNGAVPNEEDADPLFRAQFRALMALMVSHGVDVHFPVESLAKATFYRLLVGDLITVRESVHDAEEFVHKEGAVSTSVGSGLPMLDRIKAAAELARRRFTATGRKTIVCPAITSSFRAKLAKALEKLRLKKIAQKSKCGTCKACAKSNIDVIYPGH